MTNAAESSVAAEKTVSDTAVGSTGVSSGVEGEVSDTGRTRLVAAGLTVIDEAGRVSAALTVSTQVEAGFAGLTS